MRVIHDAKKSCDLLIILPAAMMNAEDVLEQGFAAAVREHALPLDVAVADAQADDYLAGGIAERLATEVVAPLRAEGYRRIWLMGMSLGATGCLAYASRHPGAIAGAILLAPFLGSRGLIDRIASAGGLARWRPDADDDEQRILLWLKNHRADDPKLYLGCGSEDRYAPASALLAPQLPPGRVLSIPGGHDAQTWLSLWKLVLAMNPFLVEA
jgi:hypothetical protein